MKIDLTRELLTAMGLAFLYDWQDRIVECRPSNNGYSTVIRFSNRAMRITGPIKVMFARGVPMFELQGIQYEEAVDAPPMEFRPGKDLLSAEAVNLMLHEMQKMQFEALNKTPARRHS